MFNKTRTPFTKNNVRKFPDSFGVYFFYDKKKNPIYIGKAINLRRRLSSYLANDLLFKTKLMVKEAKFISCIIVNSDLEALLLEAKMIRHYKPKYNFELKDDKRPLYILITNEKYPRVLTARKHDEQKKNIAFYGPFPNSGTVKLVLKMLRRIFPYSTHKLGKRVCVLHEIGLCCPCPSYIENLVDEKKRKASFKIYSKNISSLKKTLSGKSSLVRISLIKKMKYFTQKENYEMALEIRNQLSRLDYITQKKYKISNYLTNPNLLIDLRASELKHLHCVINNIAPLKKVERIECFDVAHMSGSSPTASMITFIKAQPDKSLYRHFQIKQKSVMSDYDSMYEVAKRRARNIQKWGRPDLIVVDGGKSQISAFLEVFISLKICVVGIAKQREVLIIPIILRGKVMKFETVKLVDTPALFLLQRLRDEAHRFARRYHHNLMKKRLIKNYRDIQSK